MFAAQTCALSMKPSVPARKANVAAFYKKMKAYRQRQFARTMHNNLNEAESLANYIT